MTSQRPIEESRQTDTDTNERAHSTRIDRDERLVEDLRLGESTAAERLLGTYGDRAYRLARSITRDRLDAEEVVQDAFIAVVGKIDTFKGVSAFGSWLYRIVANAAYQKLRGRRRAGASVSLGEISDFVDEHGAPVVDWSLRVQDPALQTDLRIVLTAAIDALPADHRAALVLRDVEGLSTHEIGAALGLSIANVKSRVHRARLFLRKRLGDYMATIETGHRAPKTTRPGRAPAACLA